MPTSLDLQFHSQQTPFGVIWFAVSPEFDIDHNGSPIGQGQGQTKGEAFEALQENLAHYFG